MNSTKRAVYQDILLRAHEQHRLTLAVAGSQSGAPVIPGLAPDPFQEVESEIDRLIAEQEAEELMAIERALDVLRRAPQQYGLCEVCHQQIATQRLSITPWTTRCDAHDREHSFRD